MLLLKFSASLLNCYQLPVSVIWTMVAVITTALRPYRVTSAPAILDTHWTLINTSVLVSQVLYYLLSAF